MPRPDVRGSPFVGQQEMARVCRAVKVTTLAANGVVALPRELIRADVVDPCGKETFLVDPGAGEWGKR
jgi:hypothetical protein